MGMGPMGMYGIIVSLSCWDPPLIFLYMLIGGGAKFSSGPVNVLPDLVLKTDDG